MAEETELTDLTCSSSDINTGEESGPFMYATKEIYIRKSEEDKKEWTEWRNAKKGHVFFASNIANLCGCGYTSTKAAVEYKLGLKEQPKPNEFLKRAMAHGVAQENNAILKVKTMLGENVEYHPWTWGLEIFPSCIFKVHELEIGGTPDSIFISKAIDATPIVCEIKCPFFWQNKFDSVDAAVNDSLKRAPYGRVNAFLQAATYNFLYGGQEFKVAMYYTSGVEEVCVIHTYAKTPAVERMIIQRLRLIKKMLEHQKYKRLKSMKPEIELLIKQSHIHIQRSSAMYDTYYKIKI